MPERIYDWAFVLPVTGGTENFRGVIVTVVAVAVATKLFFNIVFHVMYPCLHVFLVAKMSHA